MSERRQKVLDLALDGKHAESVVALLDYVEAIAITQREVTNKLDEQILDLQVSRTSTLIKAFDILEFLKERSPGWATNDELRRLVGNQYREARTALAMSGLVEVKYRKSGERGADEILTGWVEGGGGTVGRITRKRILDSLLGMGPDIETEAFEPLEAR